MFLYVLPLGAEVSELQVAETCLNRTMSMIVLVFNIQAWKQNDSERGAFRSRRLRTPSSTNLSESYNGNDCNVKT